jgi:hypothetical protein
MSIQNFQAASGSMNVAYTSRLPIITNMPIVPQVETGAMCPLGDKGEIYELAGLSVGVNREFVARIIRGSLLQ